MVVRLISLLLALALIAVGCSDDDESSSEPDTSQPSETTVAAAAVDEVADSTTSTTEAEPVAGPDIVHWWAPVSLANRAAQEIDEAQAVEIAQGTDVIVQVRGALDRHSQAMRTANPDLDILIYLNAAFAQANEGDTYPDEWYARDANGDRIRSNGFNNWLMNPREPGWIEDRVEMCAELAELRGYDGCYLDIVGSAPIFPGYATGIPIDPATGEEFTHNSWHEATAQIARAVQEGNPGLDIIGNGAANGRRYFSDDLGSSIVVAELDAAIAELWIRRAPQPIDQWPTLTEWLEDVNMLTDSEAAGKPIYTLTKIGVEATDDQIDQWYRFSLGSFLLGAQGESKFAFTGDEKIDPLIHPELPDLGGAYGPYVEMPDDIYVRYFERGMVAVNPTGSAAAVDLDQDYVTEEGDEVSGRIEVPAHDAAILLVP